MNNLDLQKLLTDISDHYKEDIGQNFAKAVGRLIADLSWDEQKRELLTIIAQLVDMGK